MGRDGSGRGGLGARTPYGSGERWPERVDQARGKAGLGTPHMDGNTRLCTATAATALVPDADQAGRPQALVPAS